MEQKIAIIHENTINTILEQQQRILNLLQDKNINNNADIFCNVKEAAKILNISEQKIRLMIDNDELKYRKLGRTIRIYRSSLM